MHLFLKLESLTLKACGHFCLNSAVDNDQMRDFKVAEKWQDGRIVQNQNCICPSGAAKIEIPPKYHQMFIWIERNRQSKRDENKKKKQTKFSEKRRTHRESAKTKCLIVSNDCFCLHLFSVAFTLVIYSLKFVFVWWFFFLTLKIVIKCAK